MELFARHMAANAKVLDEDQATGAKKYRYFRTGEDHFSLAFTYAWMAASERTGPRGFLIAVRTRIKRMKAAG